MRPLDEAEAPDWPYVLHVTRVRSLVLLPRRHPGAADTVLAAFVVALAQAEVWLAGSTDAPRPVLAAAAVAMLSLAWRRRAPLMSTIIAIGTVIAVAAFWRLDGAWWALAVMLAVYSVAAHGERRDALLGAALALVAHALGGLQEGTDGVGEFLGNFSFPAVVLVGAPWVAGRALRSRRLHADVLEDRAEAVQRESEERARAAVAEERLRIARELHDVVGHSLGVIVVQAGAERATLPPGRETTRETLVTIEQTGREALGEMRRLLDLMRRDDEQVALAPQPSLARLDTLVDKVRAAGLPIELRVHGEPVPLPPGVDLSAYRIVQEALTNALKHAGPARARVTVRYAQDSLELEVIDDGPGATQTGDRAGHGLAGMGERVALHGGTLRTATQPGGGYAVSVRLPFESPRT